jgi:hypothetical protein
MQSITNTTSSNAPKEPRQPDIHAIKRWRYRRIFQWSVEWDAAQTSAEADAVNRRFAGMK